MGRHSITDSSGPSSVKMGTPHSPTGKLPCGCAIANQPDSLPTDSTLTQVCRAQPRITFHHGTQKYRVYEDDGYTQWPTSTAARARFDQIRRWRQADALTDQG